jgi:hypothetical protein
MRTLSLVSLVTVLGSTAALAQPSKGSAAPPPGKGSAAAPAKVEPPKPPPPPAEVKTTVDAFKGNWKFDATLQAPGMDKPAAFKMTFNCKAAAGNTAALCESKAKTPMGPFDGTFIAVYDPFSKAMHFFGITNQHEVHDHVCAWKGTTEVTCNPYKGGMGPGGDPITEDLSMKWADAKTLSFTSVSTMKDGSKITFEGKGKR